MAVELNEMNGGKVLEVLLSGKLVKEDYEQFGPAVERLVTTQGTIKMLVEIHNFHGWTAGALWEDIKFDARHFNDIARLAIIGEKSWEHSMAIFCKPFTTAKIRYFNVAEADAARAWLKEPGR